MMRHVLALGLIFVVGWGWLAASQQLSGTWEIDFEIDPQEASFADALELDTTLKVNYSIGDWTFGSATVLDEEGWVDQDFSTTGILGAFTLTGAVDFNPDGTFGSLVATISVPFAGVLFGAQLTLEDSDTFLSFTASSSAGLVDIDVDLDFGDNDDICDFPWDDATISIDFPFCCGEVSSELRIGCEGFEHFKAGVTGLVVPNIPWLTMGAEVRYTLQTKGVVISPAFDFGADACVDFYISVDSSSPLSIGSIHLDGIALSCDFGTVTFTGITYWAESSKPGKLSSTEYFEVYTLESTEDACCGPLSFEMSVFFLEAGLNLFDVSKFDANLELELSPQFEFNMGLEIDVEGAATVVWKLGFFVDW